MSTPEERRKTADWYRGLASEVEDWGESNPWWYVMKGAYSDIDRHDANDLFRLLADLIDPTAGFESMDCTGRPPYKQDHINLNSSCNGCKNCGYPFGSEYLGPFKHPNYCPNCGCRIVEEEK